ncbi:MAG: beta galactosidase jelly roll domain-containing protein [Lachnospiraceae bacterium]|nr:beta galactosidase jelly roll domain-containing protein [Lachnospiraceae bacterium]
MLYPQLNESRMRVELDGIWDFQTAGADSYEKELVKKPLVQPMTMAVPASYNDQKDDVNLRSHYGWVVYQKTFTVPRMMSDERIVLRFGAVTHQAEVYLNGQHLGSHKGGFLPFEFDVTFDVKLGENLLAVAVDNRVNYGTLPVGNENAVAFFGSDNPGIPSIEMAKTRCRPQNKPNFDFFNYAGIIRPVWLYTTPKCYIRDISIVTDVNQGDGIVKFQISTETVTGGKIDGCTYNKYCGTQEKPSGQTPDAARTGQNQGELFNEEKLSELSERHVTEERCEPDQHVTQPCVHITILDETQNVVTDFVADQISEDGTLKGSCLIPDAKLWNPGAAYLYTLRVEYGEDMYEQKFGIRTVEVRGTEFLINGKPFYFKGFGKHEDSYFHGRGMDPCLNVKDLSLIRWLHANSFRTSHYPYAEEMYDLCDREGIVVIDETPAVGIGAGSATNPYQAMRIHDHHRDVVRDMIDRDKNHPCVVMWSLANEPDLENFPQDAHDYFTPLYELAHSLDPQNRPVTLVCCQNNYEKDLTTRTMDVVCLNRYYGWYNLGGDLDAACDALNIELDFWEKQDKPVMFTEYGADTYPGIHNTNGEMFSEEYQADYYLRINAEIDKRSFFIGEQLWNFADFATIQGPMRVDGNKKGILTRDRRPKLAAHALRRRWEGIPDFGYKE